MNPIHLFIEKYLDKYLAQCQMQNPFDSEEIQAPPNGKELEALMTYLLSCEVDPVIVGSIAVIRHLELSDEDIKHRRFRPVDGLDILVSKKLPKPLPGWQEMKDVDVSWLSPRGGNVKFFMSPDGASISPNDIDKVEKDPESILMDCPIADIASLFKMKLNSDQVRDVFEVLSLVIRRGIPSTLDENKLNEMQKNNLAFIKHFAKQRIGKEKWCF